MVLKLTKNQKKTFKFAVVKGDDIILRLTRKASIAKKVMKERQERLNRVAKFRGVTPKRVKIVDIERKILSKRRKR